MKARNDKRCMVVLSDLGAADQHPAAVSNVVEFIGDYQPAEVCVIGSVTVCSACCAGMDIGTPKHDNVKLLTAMRRLRERYDGPVTIKTPNLLGFAGDRCSGACGLPGTELEDLGATITEAGSFMTGWFMAYTGDDHHSAPGLHAITWARRMGRPVVFAGTTAPAIVSDTVGAGPQRRTIYGMAIGSLRSSAWRRKRQKGFGIIEQSANGAKCHLVSVRDSGTFIVNGFAYDKRLASDDARGPAFRRAVFTRHASHDAALRSRQSRQARP